MAKQILFDEKARQKFLEEKNVPLPEEYVFHGDYSRRSARLAAEHFLKVKERPTAIFAASDDMALELIAAFLEKGIKIPRDISILGFDDNPACLYSPVALTTLRQPLFKMAEDAVRILNAIISGKNKEKNKIILSPELVIRESCAAPKE